jgi:hypothetical protein
MPTAPPSAPTAEPLGAEQPTAGLIAYLRSPHHVLHKRRATLAPRVAIVLQPDGLAPVAAAPALNLPGDAAAPLGPAAPLSRKDSAGLM